MAAHEFLARWSAGFWPAFANHLWRATLFALAVLLLLRILELPQRSRYALTVVAGLAFLVPPMPAASLVRSLSPAAARTGPALALRPPELLSWAAAPIRESAPVPLAPAEPVRARSFTRLDFSVVLTCVWGAGVVASAGWWLARLRRRSRHPRVGREPLGPERSAFARAARSVPARVRAALVVSRLAGEPAVQGIRRPVIVLPEGLSAAVSEDELETILLHELIHVQRHDNLAGLVQRIACAVLWFHPLVWWLDERLCAERELCRDEEVVERLGHGHDYASALLKAVRFAVESPIAAISYAARCNLERRVEMIVRSSLARRQLLWQRLLAPAAAVALVAVSASSVLLAEGGLPAALSRRAVPASLAAVVTPREAQRASAPRSGPAARLGAPAQPQAAGAGAAIPPTPAAADGPTGTPGQAQTAGAGAAPPATPPAAVGPTERPRAIPAGLPRLSAEVVADLERRIAADPAGSLDLRAILLPHYAVDPSPEAREARLRHVLWVIESAPDSQLAGTFAYVDNVLEPAGYAQARDLWLKHVAAQPRNVGVLGNAASFFMSSDRDRAEGLLKAAAGIEPSNPLWHWRLGHLYLLKAKGPMGDTAADGSARTALAEFESALALGNDAGRTRGLQDAAIAALRSGEAAKAEKYATELLQRAGTDAHEGDAIHEGHRVLGHLALAAGDVEAAKEHLIAAGKTPGSAVLHSFGPELTLASALLARGERETVVQYLIYVSRFWVGHQRSLDELVERIRAGESPQLDRSRIQRDR